MMIWSGSLEILLSSSFIYLTELIVTYGQGEITDTLNVDLKRRTVSPLSVLVLTNSLGSPGTITVNL